MFSIRTKLTLALLALLIPQLLLGWVNIRDRAELQRVLVERNQASIAQGAASALDSALIDILRTTEVTGNFLMAVDLLGEQNQPQVVDANDYLRQVRARQRFVRSMVLLSPQGRVIAADPPELVGQDLSKREDIARLLQSTSPTGDLVLGNLYEGPPPYFTASIALRLSGRLVGIVSSSVDTGLVADVMRSPLAGTNDLGLVLDGSSRVIYYGSSKDEIPLTWSERDFSARRDSLMGGDDITLPKAGGLYIGTLRLTSITNWSVGVYSPVSDAFAAANQQTQRDIIVLASVSLLTLLLIIGVGNILTRPVLTLTGYAERLRAGDLSNPVTLTTHDEFQRLGDTFNQMAASLNETISELRQTRDQVQRQAIQLQQLLSRTNTVQEAERKRLAFEIHDGAIQTIIAAKFEMQAAARSLAENPEKAAFRLRTARELVDNSIVELRQIVFDLRPTYLDSTGLVAALNKFMDNFEIIADVEGEVISEGTPFNLPNDIKVALYRIVQEAMSNVLKHAHATTATIFVRFGTPDSERQATVTVEIVDNGQGFDQANLKVHDETPLSGLLGLSSMEERAQSIGGSFTLESELGKGTKITVQVPVQEQTPT